LRKVAITGGPPIALYRVGSNVEGVSWGADEVIVFATADAGTGLLSVPAGGGEPKALTTPDRVHGERDHLFPSVLPGARAVLFTIQGNGSADNNQIAVLDLEHLIYTSAGALRAVRFNLARLEVQGDPVPVVDQVRTKGNGAASMTSRPTVRSF
jgi:hypothetical protein